MTEPNSPTRKRPQRRASGQWMLGAVIALAVVGTGVWIFSEDKRWGLISLILLVWGLVIAAFLLARYARDLRTAESKEGNLKAVYELQLEREISARREYELQLERDLRSELRNEANEELTALKSEVLALRANLEELLGRDLGPSYSELYAAAEQRAIAAARQANSMMADDHFRAQQDFASVPTPAADVDSYYGATSAVPHESEPAPQPRPQQPSPASSGDSPTTVFSSVRVDTDGPLADAVDDAQPVDVEHVEGFDPAAADSEASAGFTAYEPGDGSSFVPLAPQSGYRSPIPPRRYVAPQDAEGDESAAAPGPQSGPSGTSAWRDAFTAPSRSADHSDVSGPAQQPTPPRDAGDGEEATEFVEVDGAQASGTEESDSTRGQHTSGNTVAELIARMSADTERNAGGRRHRND